MLVGRKTLKAQLYLELKRIFTGKPVMTSKCKLHYLKRYRFKTKDQVIASIKGKLNIVCRGRNINLTMLLKSQLYEPNGYNAVVLF